MRVVECLLPLCNFRSVKKSHKMLQNVFLCIFVHVHELYNHATSRLAKR